MVFMRLNFIMVFCMVKVFSFEFYRLCFGHLLLPLVVFFPFKVSIAYNGGDF